MKTLKFMFPALLLMTQAAFGQENARHLTLSAKYPSANEKIDFVYDSSGTPLAGKKDINAAIYFLDNKKYPVADASLQPDGQKLKGEFIIPATAKAFFVRLSSGSIIDDNGGNGYLYMIYKDKQPVEGARAMVAYAISSGLGRYYAGIKTDRNKAISLYQQEFAIYPASRSGNYSNFYYTLVARDPQYKDTVAARISLLEKEGNDKSLSEAVQLLKVGGQIKAADSLTGVTEKKFPVGVLAENNKIMAFFRETDLAKKDSMYQAFMKQFPENDTSGNTMQDAMRATLAEMYLAKGDTDSFEKYRDLLHNKARIAGALNNIAYEWAKKGEKLDQARKLSKQSLDDIITEMKNPKPGPFASPEQLQKNLQYTYDMYADTYALILLKQKDYAEAMKYEQPVIDHSTSVDGEVYGHYIEILTALGEYKKAEEYAVKAVVAGQGDDAIKAALKAAYVKLKGNDSGYDDYLAGLEKESRANELKSLAKTMIDQPASAFTLKDLNGNTVSLSSLKGKVVVVDFWATWCGPCKASFPGMQLAVNKYKDDPDVKFLFVDCWENGDHYETGVQKFIADHKYTFHVLLDEKGADGRQSKVTTAYGVTGIPTKFIIDKNGNIRFRYVGYSGTPEALEQEVSDMITLAANPQQFSSNAVSSNTKNGSK